MGDTRVRTYTRTVNGRTVTVRAHDRDSGDGDSGEPELTSAERQYGPGDAPDDDPAAQKRRHAFERRVVAERQRSEAKYDTGTRRTPGEKRARKKSAGTKARQHWRKGRRTSKKHSWKRAWHHAAAGFWGAAAAGRWAGRKLRGEWS